MNVSDWKKVSVAILMFLMGSATATYLHWPALTNHTTYRSDTRQSPHWAAYHSDTFRSDDLLLKLASYNESPLENLIFYIGTYFLDVITLSKVMSVIGYGLASALFFVIGQSMFGGIRPGCLCAIFFTLFPDQFEYFNGGFSKAWMIPLLLICIYLMKNQQWRGLIILLPFSALAYPMSAVLIGLTILCYLMLNLSREPGTSMQILRYLAIGSGVALVILLSKYAFVDPEIGPITPGEELAKMPEMFRGGLNNYLPVRDLYEQLLRDLKHPFTIYGSIMFFLILKRKVVWERPWTALVLASMITYVLAKYFFMRLYIPNRYTRYSIAVLLILWNSGNCELILQKISWRGVRGLALIAILALAGFSHRETLDQGEDTINREKFAGICAKIRQLPKRSLIAGHPFYMDDIPLQGRRSVLCNYKLAHPWYSIYYQEIKARTHATFQALYATDKAAINALHHRHRVTHLFVVKFHYDKKTIRTRRHYVHPYNDYIRKLIGKKRKFILASPPKESIIYEDHDYQLIELPLK
jgi:hypothetical protein